MYFPLAGISAGHHQLRDVVSRLAGHGCSQLTQWPQHEKDPERSHSGPLFLASGCCNYFIAMTTISG